MVLGQRGSIEFLQKFKNTYEITHIYKLVALISLVIIVRYFFYLYIDNINTKNANQIMETALKKWFNLDLYQQQAEAPTFSHNLSQTISRSNAIIRSIFRNILVDTVIFLLFFASMLYQYFSYFLVVWFFLNIIAARYIIPKVNKIYKEYTIAHKKI